MSSNALRLEIEKLKTQLADRDAAIMDRDAKIETLAQDLNVLKKHIQQMLSGRRGTPLLAEGQGVLFPESCDPVGQESSEEDSGDAMSDDGDAESDDEDSDRCQDSCRLKLFHQAAPLVGWFSAGFRRTTLTSDQSLVCPDQRAGFLA